MNPRWYFRGQTFTDEIGSFTIPVRRSGWYSVINHYGNITVEQWPGGLWWGLWRYKVTHRD